MKEWYSAKELVGIGKLSIHSSNINRQARKENWEFRAISGVKGGGIEYAFHSLPQDTQQELRLRFALTQVAETTEQPKAKASLGTALNNASNKEREEAAKKAEAVRVLQSHLSVGLSFSLSLQLTSEQQGVSEGSLKNWYYKVRDHNVHEWQALLIKKTGKQAKPNQKAFIEQEAWDVFLADYLRPEQPTLNACYRRTLTIAKQMGWEMASKGTFQRRLKEIPYEVILLRRKGANAVAKLVPALRRTVKDLFAMEWLNGDGYQHNVFVRFPNGEIGRPKTWFWQGVDH